MTKADDTLPTLILSDGGVTSQLAVAIASEATARAGSIAVAPPLVAQATAEPLPQPAVGEAIALHAESFGCKVITLPNVGAPANAADPIARARAESIMLINAAYAAAELGCRKVIWPTSRAGATHQEDPDLAPIASAIDRALLITRTVNLEADHFPVPDVSIETPFVDLTDEQIIDLFQDMRLSMNTCWFNLNAAKTGDLATIERNRWAGHAAMAIA